MTITNHGSIDHYITGMGAERLLDCFVAIKKAMDFFCTGPGGSLYTRVASNYGTMVDGVTPATGFDYHDEANPCGDNAFVVYKSLKLANYYVMFQANRGVYGGAPSLPTTYGSAPGDPSVTFGNASGYWEQRYGRITVAMAAIYNAGGPVNPWKGTTNNNGTDTKGATPHTGPVWGASVGNLLAFPRENSQGGFYATNKEYCAPIAIFTDNVASPGASRVHVVASDAGHLFIAIDGSLTGSYMGADTNQIYNGMMLVGPVDEVHPAITPQVNLMMLTRIGNGNNGTYTLVGDDYIPNNYWLDGASYRSGGVAHPTASKGTMSFYNYLPKANVSPNGLLPADTYDDREWSIRIYDTLTGTLIDGFYGNMTWLRCAQNVLSEGQNATKTMTAFGRGDTRYTWKNAVPWDGVTVVGGFVRTGVQF